MLPKQVNRVCLVQYHSAQILTSLANLAIMAFLDCPVYLDYLECRVSLHIFGVFIFLLNWWQISMYVAKKGIICRFSNKNARDITKEIFYIPQVHWNSFCYDRWPDWIHVVWVGILDMRCWELRMGDIGEALRKVIVDWCSCRRWDWDDSVVRWCRCREWDIICRCINNNNNNNNGYF